MKKYCYKTVLPTVFAFRNVERKEFQAENSFISELKFPEKNEK